MKEMLLQIPWWVWPALVWDIIWKMIGLWKSARNNHRVWFFLIFILNTIGILPLVYVLFFLPKYKRRRNDVK